MNRVLSETLSKMSSEYWKYLFTNCKEENKDILLLTELMGCLPFSMAIIGFSFSAVRRVITDWRCNLQFQSVNTCLHFSVHKGFFENDTSGEKGRLIKVAAETFVKGDGSNDFGLSTRRINKLMKHYLNIDNVQEFS